MAEIGTELWITDNAEMSSNRGSAQFRQWRKYNWEMKY